MIVVPITHDLIHLAAVHTACLSLNLLDEVAEERGAWRKRRMVDVAVQGLVHCEHELSHPHSFPHVTRPRVLIALCNIYRFDHRSIAINQQGGLSERRRGQAYEILDGVLSASSADSAVSTFHV